MFPSVPAVLGGYRQLMQRLPAGIRHPVSCSADTWTCGCGHAHRYVPSRTNGLTTLVVTCPDCHKTATLRIASGGNRAPGPAAAEGATS